MFGMYPQAWLVEHQRSQVDLIWAAMRVPALTPTASAPLVACQPVCR